MHFDWLSIHQQHDPHTLDDFGSAVLLRLVIDEDGNQRREWETVSHHQHEGSHDSTLSVRCFSGRVEVSGNPSRFGRPDNLWGYEVMSECVALYNSVLRDLGLPEFTSGPNLSRRPDGHGQTFGSTDSAHTDAQVSMGAQITRVDIATNVEAGRDAGAVVLALDSVIWRGSPPNRHGKSSLSWGSRRHRRLKIYDKGAEIRSNTKKSSQDRPHRLALAQYCDEVGMLRFELELHRDTLRQSGLRELRHWNDDHAKEIMRSQVDKMMPQVRRSTLSGIAQELIDHHGLGRRQALMLQGLAYQWRDGIDVFEQLSDDVSRATAYRYRAQLRKVGIDIRTPPSKAEVITVQPRVVDLVPAGPPAWYDLPRACA